MKFEQQLIREQANEIRRLNIENRRLRRENRRLSHYDDKVLTSGQHSDSPESTLLSSLSHDSQIINSSSYPKYIYRMIRQSSPFRIWTRIMTYFRRFRVVSVILRFSAQIIAIIETSAILLVAATAFLITIPVMLVMLIVALIAALTRGRSLNRQLEHQLKGKHIFIFFPTSSPAPGYGSVLHATVEQLCRDSDNMIFVVSPHTVSSRVFGQCRLFFMARQPQENVFYIRKFYYFMLRRKLLRDISERVAVIF